MDDVDELLFGRFPRDGATPSRFTLFSPGHYDLFKDKCDRTKTNPYVSISHFQRNVPVTDKVVYDFDAKPDEYVPGEWSDAKTLLEMTEDTELATEILSPVVDDVQKIVQLSRKRGIPTVGVYTGFGIHVHQLYRPEPSPKRALTSTAVKYREELDLQTLDPKPVGDVQRIVRLPNTQRYEDDKPTGVYTVPLQTEEMASLTVSDLIRLSDRPRDLNVSEPDSRPSLTVYDEYIGSGKQAIPHRPTREADQDRSEDAEFIISEMISMPCIRERALSKSPRHKVRFNVAVMLYNLGYKPQEVYEVIRGLNWTDFEPEMTKKQLKQIWKTGYSESSCETMRVEGLCVKEDKPESCPAYQRRGKQCQWK